MDENIKDDIEESKGITLGDLIGAVKKNWIVMAIIVVAITLIGSLYVKLGVTPTYSAHSSIVVQVPTSSSSNNVDVSNSIRYVYTVTNLITDESIAKKAMECTDKINDEAVNSSVVQYNETHDTKITESLICSKVSASADTNSLYVKIKVVDTDKERAVAVVKAVTKAIKSMENDSNEATTDDLICYITIAYMPQEIADVSYVGPNVLLYVIISFLVGAVVACAFAFIKEFASSKFKTKEEVESMGYPVIGVQRDDKSKEKNPGHELIDGTITAMDPYNRILNGIKYSDFNKQIKVIMVTSSGQSELKSSVVANLAYTAGLNNKKVILIDLDVRKARLHQIFNLNKDNGIVEYLDGEINKEELIKHTDKGIDVITMGKKISNPTVILESTKLNSLIDELKQEYDYVFIDTAPLMACTDSLIISKMVDGIVFNVAMNQYKKKDINECIKSLKEVNANILGIDITKYKAESRRDYQYYGYKNYSMNMVEENKTESNN